MKWHYIDHSKKDEYIWNGKVFNDGTLVFSCEAESIGDADFQFMKETGKDVIKMPQIGCRCEGPKVPQSREDVSKGNYERLRAVMLQRLGREWTESIERDAKR